MSEWLNPVANVFASAVGVVLLIKYRDRGILRQIGESKHRFRIWLKSVAHKPE